MTQANEPRGRTKLCQRFVKMFGCDAARICSQCGRLFLIIGRKRSTRKDASQWYKNGKPIHFTYLQERVIASGRNQQELIRSALEYKRLEGIAKARRPIMANEQALREALELARNYLNGAQLPDNDDGFLMARIETALAASEPRPDTDEGLSSEELAARWPGGNGRREPRQAGETSAPELPVRIEYDPTSRYHYVVLDNRNRWLMRTDKRSEAEQFIACLAEPATPKPPEGGAK